MAFPRIFLTLVAVFVLETVAWAQPDWQSRAPGFETAEISLNMFSLGLGSLSLVRVDPVRWHFAVKLDGSGAHDLARWQDETQAALVINGSFFGSDNRPVTPVLSGGVLHAPARYASRSAAFVAGKGAAVVSLKGRTWQKAFLGQSNGLVSFPALIVNGKEVRIGGRGKLANRSFIAQDKAGRIVMGTTSLAPLSLQGFAHALAGMGLDLMTAVNLDGGPLACQGLRLGAVRRVTCDAQKLPEGLSGALDVQKLPIVIVVTGN